MAPATIARTDDLAIRPATRADMPMVADFVRSSAEWYRPIVDPKDMDEHQVGEEWAETNFRRRDFYIGLADEQEPIGTISLQYFGDWAYVTMLHVNTWFNYLRRKLGFGYWSLSAYLKHRVKNAVQFISSFEEAVSDEAKRRKVDGVVCGHIHHAEMKFIGDILYINDGDWVESCTALVEDHRGGLQILNWAEEMAQEAADAAVSVLQPAA